MQFLVHPLLHPSLGQTNTQHSTIDPDHAFKTLSWASHLLPYVLPSCDNWVTQYDDEETINKKQKKSSYPVQNTSQSKYRPLHYHIIIALSHNHNTNKFADSQRLRGYSNRALLRRIPCCRCKRKLSRGTVAVRVMVKIWPRRCACMEGLYS